MIRTLKFLLFLFLLTTTSNVNSKPVPPGAGDGDVAANILFLVDSSASMGRWIGGDGLGASWGVTYDSQDRILIGQNARRSMGSVIRYTAAGARDRAFTPIRVIPRVGCTETVDATRGIARQRLRRAGRIKFVEDVTTPMQTTAQNMIFINSRERRTGNFVFGFSEDGRTCLLAIAVSRGGIGDIDVKTIDGTNYLFMAGAMGRRGGIFKSCNLNTMQCREQQFLDRNHISARFGGFSVNNDASMIYFSHHGESGDLVGYSLTSVGGAFELGNETRRCSAVNGPTLTSQMAFATGVEVSPNDSDIVYTTSHINHAIQKIEWTGNTCAVVTSIGNGTASVATNVGTAGTLVADNVYFRSPWGLHIKNDHNTGQTRILTSTNGGYVDEFNEGLVTSANRNTAWLQQMGGPRIRRWDGVKQALNAIVNDTTLTTGAYFGFGHWNAGEQPGRRAPRGGQFCHRNDGCQYYGGWGGVSTTFGTETTEVVTGQDAEGNDITTEVVTQIQTDTGNAASANQHPNGTSTICYSDACINVAVSPRGASQIMDVFNPLGMAWGTDANAFSQMAEDYFNDANAGAQLLDPDSDCQLNYVIVIGDGAMNHTGVLGARGQTAARMARLREKGVKSIYVAYGGGITGVNLNRFHELARIGSSTATTTAECTADEECERAIVALTPEDLKTELTARIRQIIADKLAFTAPSITATIQEGGSLYQAQFAYEQYGEWRGTLLRKKLKADGTVEHNTDPGNEHGNWSAATMIKRNSTSSSEVDTRNIWSAMPGSPYLGNWDNFNTNASDAIRDLFDRLGYTIPDYHTASSDCPDVGNDTVLGDEVIGLINFMKGNDYFDYDADCDVTEVRDHVMGDIYHSQLVEVGAPDANVSFSNTNEEAFFRATHGYQNFMNNYATRRNIIYAGSNSGILHAINAKTGEEEWAFIPPFIGSLIPQIVNPGLDGDVDGGGGTNPIFGVDGSPVVHDVFIRGYNQNGEVEGAKSWRTLLFVPYGRGGAGFSALDITAPIPVGGKGPIHMFSVYNDRINSRVLVADVDGNITNYDYNKSSSNLIDSSEGEMATDNYNEAREKDDEENAKTDPPGESTEEQDKIARCVSSTTFKDDGTNSCYTGNTYHFPNLQLDYELGTEIPNGILSATELVNNVSVPIKITSAQMTDDAAGGAILKVVFENSKVINASQSTITTTTTVTNDDGTTSEVTTETLQSPSNLVNVTACLGASGVDPDYDYSRLGETWSTPRIIRMPISSDSSYKTDRYVAILGGGNAKNDRCGGSALFLVDLEGHVDDKPGRIFAAEKNGGPITIVDTSPQGVAFGSDVVSTPNGSDIPNAITGTPVVITPDTAPNIPWRGALVYINDLEGKITKINLSNNTKGYNETGQLEPGVTKLYDQTTLFRLNASEANARYSYFGMDAGLGLDDGGFWLFGSTGNFTDLGGREAGMDNILYGVQDKHYPFWKHLNSTTVPAAVVDASADPIQINPEFLKAAHKGANDADIHVGNAMTCENVTGNGENENCPISSSADAWVVHLEKQKGAGNSTTYSSPRTFRKASASPTLFKGKVYFPIYQPPVGVNRCNQGHAFICATDDECGTNNSEQLGLPVPEGVDASNPTVNACAYVREGVLSELVIFSDKLFANVAGPSDDESTLFSILSIPGDVISNRGGWRDSSF